MINLPPLWEMPLPPTQNHQCCSQIVNFLILVRVVIFPVPMVRRSIPVTVAGTGFETEPPVALPRYSDWLPLGMQPSFQLAPQSHFQIRIFQIQYQYIRHMVLHSYDLVNWQLDGQCRAGVIHVHTNAIIARRTV